MLLLYVDKFHDYLDCQFRISGFHFRDNVVLRIKVTRYVAHRLYLGEVPNTCNFTSISKSKAGEWLSPGGVLFIRYRDTEIQPSNRGAQPSPTLELAPTHRYVHHSTSIFVSVESPYSVASTRRCLRTLGNPNVGLVRP